VTLNKKRGLGRGLSDLGLNELLTRINEQDIQAEKSTANTLEYIKLDQITPGKFQPRKVFDEQALEELAESIRAQGIIQPVIVRKIKNNAYEILAGERRCRAAKLAGLTDVPVVIRDIPDDAAGAVSLIENIQREDLNAIEEASAFQRLSEEFGLTHQQIASIVGKSRATITNLLRLLSLSQEVKELVESGKLEMGHARALLSLPESQQHKVSLAIVDKKMTVREAEHYIRTVLNLGNLTSKKPKNLTFLNMEKNLSKKLGSRVSIKHQENGKGKLIVHYHNIEKLKELVEAF
jgi:ParB family chromosome partitioning protein